MYKYIQLKLTAKSTHLQQLLLFLDYNSVSLFNCKSKRNVPGSFLLGAKIKRENKSTAATFTPISENDKSKDRLKRYKRKYIIDPCQMSALNAFILLNTPSRI